MGFTYLTLSIKVHLLAEKSNDQRSLSCFPANPPKTKALESTTEMFDPPLFVGAISEPSFDQFLSIRNLYRKSYVQCGSI